MIDAYQLVVLIPYAAALVLVAIPGYRVGAIGNVVGVRRDLRRRPVAAGRASGSVGDYAIVDEFNIVFIVINTLVGFTTALFSASYIGHEIETGRLSPTFVRFYHAMFQAMMGSMNLALIANNIGLMWVGLELATLITVVMVGLYRTPQAIEAAWKYFILASVGISLAFFGTILIYLAGQPALGEGVPAMTWSLLQAAAARMDPAILDLAFIFLLIGYGTKVGLAPLHAWLPDAHAEGPTPISAVLSGLLLNVALYALLRFKMLVAGQPAALDPGPIMIVMGLVSLIFAAFMLYQRRDIKAVLRLLVDRAHGADRVRLRHGRAARQFRRPAAHGHAQPDQVGNLLRCRPRRPGQGHAAHRRNQGTERHPSPACRGLRAGGACDLPACRRSACSPASS